MKKYAIYLTLSIWTLYLALPLRALAIDAPAVMEPVYPKPVIITEIQTGAGTAGDEFVELYNTSSQAVDVTGWQVRYINATVSSPTTLLATIAKEDGTPVFIEPRSYYVLRTSTTPLVQAAASQTYSAKLSSSDKAVGLFAPNLQTCELEPDDAIAWGSSTMGEGSAAINPAGSGDRLIRRFINSDGFYVDTNANLHDVIVSLVAKDTLMPAIAGGATPGAPSIMVIGADTPPIPPSAISTMPHTSIAGCTPPVVEEPGGVLEPPTEEPPVTVEPDDTPQNEEAAKGPVMPTRDIGLKSPQITELLPNPGSPLMDASDEFIEIYNSNDAVFDLSGFMLEYGAATTKRYTFPQGTLVNPKTFKAFFSADTRIALSNTQGQVRLLDPFGKELGKTDAYGSAKDNQAWALASGSWRWTASPSPNAANIIKAPAAKSKASKASASNSKATSNKTTGVKGLSTTATTTDSQLSDELEKTPIHTGVLALVGVFAILYGAYEYRSDLANKIFQLRSYRTARREARQSAKGR